MTTGLDKFRFLLQPAENGIDAAEIVLHPHEDDCKTEALSFAKPLCFQWHTLTHWTPSQHRPASSDSTWLADFLSNLWSILHDWSLRFILAAVLVYFVIGPFLTWLWNKCLTSLQRTAVPVSPIAPSAASLYSNEVSASSGSLYSSDENSTSSAPKVMIEDATELENKTYVNSVLGNMDTPDPLLEKQSELSEEQSEDKRVLPHIAPSHRVLGTPSVASSRSVLSTHSDPVSRGTASASLLMVNESADAVNKVYLNPVSEASGPVFDVSPLPSTISDSCLLALTSSDFPLRASHNTWHERVWTWLDLWQIQCTAEKYHLDQEENVKSVKQQVSRGSQRSEALMDMMPPNCNNFPTNDPDHAGDVKITASRPGFLASGSDKVDRLI